MMADEKPEHGSGQGTRGGERNDAGSAGPAPSRAAHLRKTDVDWTHSAEEAAAGEESEADALLLDEGFLKRTFKEVHFPASKELCLRYVDQEQDFVYGLDRTVNLHNLITHLDEREFPSREDLIRAIKGRLAQHHHAHHEHDPR